MDALFMTAALHCITKLKSFCQEALRLTGDPSQLDKFAAKHQKLIEFVEIANSVFEIGIICQLLTALGLFVVLSFQMRYGVSYYVAIILVGTFFQLFLYCFLSECMYTKVSSYYLNKFKLISLRNV